MTLIIAIIIMIIRYSPCDQTNWRLCCLATKSLLLSSHNRAERCDLIGYSVTHSETHSTHCLFLFCELEGCAISGCRCVMDTTATQSFWWISPFNLILSFSPSKVELPMSSYLRGYIYERLTFMWQQLPPNGVNLAEQLFGIRTWSCAISCNSTG